jgi:LysR family transcriptional regulator, transcriptional activator of nhaA
VALHLNFKHLRYFHAVAHDGNLTNAARRLNVSQSALSTQIRLLEESVGHDLFERRGRRLELTEAGRVALNYADGIFETANEMLATFAGGGAQARRHLRVGAVSTLSRNFQIRFLAPMLTREDVHLVIHTGSLPQLVKALEAHEIDILLTNRLPFRDSATNWAAHLLAEAAVSLIGPQPLSDSDPSLRDLLATARLVLPAKDSGVRGDFDLLTERLGILPKIIAEADDMAMLRLLLRAGTGIGLAPPIVVRDELEAGILHDLMTVPGLTESFYAMIPSRRFPNVLVSQLLDIAKIA